MVVLVVATVTPPRRRRERCERGDLRELDGARVVVRALQVHRGLTVEP